MFIWWDDGGQDLKSEGQRKNILRDIVGPSPDTLKRHYKEYFEGL